MTALLPIVLMLFAAGPKPDKKDIPYLLLANNLVQTEVVRPSAQQTSEGTTYSIPGETSLAKTPLALPVFLIDSAQIRPEKLRLIRLIPSSGHRQALLRKTPSPDDAPLLLTATKVADTIYRLEAVNEIENGEYALNAAGSDQFFCFTVF
ncbi:MAG TPA: hypothetical protein VKB79_27675 [Bryobacteraceae bacterium]|nr:hypothetical protein [Bryobacteraceae bacterium]